MADKIKYVYHVVRIDENCSVIDGAEILANISETEVQCIMDRQALLTLCGSDAKLLKRTLKQRRKTMLNALLIAVDGLYLTFWSDDYRAETQYKVIKAAKQMYDAADAAYLETLNSL